MEIKIDMVYWLGLVVGLEKAVEEYERVIDVVYYARLLNTFQIQFWQL